jgi:hypothetical protein
LTDENSDQPKDGDVLGPEAPEPDAKFGDNYIALISQYTDRPDLLIDALERHDPGFVKEMNANSKKRSERTAEAQFYFGRNQAYAGLAVSVVAAIIILGILAFAVIEGTAGFGIIVALALFYAVTQGGPSGFMALIRAAAGYFRTGKGQDE